MDTSALATTLGARLPAWVLSELADVPETLPTDENRVRLTHRLAERNHREDTGGSQPCPVLRALLHPRRGRCKSHTLKNIT